MVDEAVYFLFYPARNMFLECEEEKITGLNLSLGLSKRAKVVQELTEKNPAAGAAGAEDENADPRRH